MKRSILLFLGILSFSITSTRAQDGTYDPSFNQGSGFPGFVYSIKVLNNQKILVGGEFSQYNNTPASNLVRLNSDGTLDMYFSLGDGFNGTVHALAVQPDGKILVAGDFTQYNNQTAIRLVRLLPDGTLDPTFASTSGANDTIIGILLQPDGKIIAYGYFEQYNGQPKAGVIRLNNDGNVDATFSTGTGTNEEVLTAALQQDGKIILGGYFTSYNGTPQNRMTRLHTDGTLDTAFAIGSGADNEIRTIALQSDGKILVGGFLNAFNGTPVPRIARLLPDGSLDATYNPGSGTSGILYNFLVLNGDYVFATGVFSSYNGLPRNSIVRLAPDGSVDTSFDPGEGIFGSMQLGLTNALQADGKLVTGGLFTSYDTHDVGSIARISNSILTLSDEETEKLMLYPNPVRDYLYFTVPKSVQLKSLNVFDNMGRHVFYTSLDATNATHPLDLSSLSAGSYLCIFSDGHRNWRKVVIKK